MKIEKGSSQVKGNKEGNSTQNGWIGIINMLKKKQRKMRHKERCLLWYQGQSINQSMKQRTPCPGMLMPMPNNSHKKQTS